MFRGDVVRNEGVQKTFEEIFATLDLDVTRPIDLGATLGADESDWRDTLRASLPMLPLGDRGDAQFRLKQMLGKGGMGVVHLAYQQALGREVAIKTVLETVTSRDAENALLQEARVMGIVEHPNVVPVHVIGQDEQGKPVIVMKRVQGTTWDAYFDGRATTASEDPQAFHLNVFVNVCNAISFAHSRGIIHRDLKPENVMIGAFGEVYVLDWGLAVSLSGDYPQIPQASEMSGVVGTPVYMAPEMTIGDGTKLGKHTDIFLLGGLLYTLVTGGAAPNRGKTLFEVMSFAYTGQPRVYAGLVPEELRSICERAMAHRPEDRYGTADELRQAVVSYLSHRSSHMLVAAAASRMEALHTAMERGDEYEAIFAEVRFAYRSALQIWAENADARLGLTSCIQQMVEHRLELNDINGARILLADLPEPDEVLSRRVAAHAEVVRAQEKKLRQMAYDYDESVGIDTRRWVVALMAAIFAVTPFLTRWISDWPVPARFLWLTDDMLVLVSNVLGFSFFPVLAAWLWYTFKRFGDHKTSRIFAYGMTWMYLLAMGARSSTLWAGTSLSMAAAAETAVFASGLAMLGLSVDGRLWRPGWLFGWTSLALAVVGKYPIEIYCAGAALACVSFVVGRKDRSRSRKNRDEDG